MNKKLYWNKNRDELLSYFAEGLLSAEEQQRIAQLIKDDPALQEEIRIHQEIARQMSAEEPPLVPESVIQKAKALVSESFGARIWNVVIQFTKDAGCRLKSDGIMIDPLASSIGALRGSTAKDPKTILIKKDFDGVSIQVEIDRAPNATNRIHIYAEDLRTKDPLNNVRVTLLDKDSELESYITDKGKVGFDNVRDGRCAIEISSPHRPIAKMTIEISPE